MAINGTTIGISLSGGGFRATLFGLGSLWRLNDAGLLGKLDRITSVSGGSILAGILANNWKNLKFVDGVAINFYDELVKPTQKFCSSTADIKATLLGWITPFKSPGDYLINHYRKSLFGDTMMKDIPDANIEGNPTFVFYATNMQTGRSFRIRQDYIADYKLGVSRSTILSLASTVAISSAFPPIFSPIILDSDPNDWSNENTFGELLENADILRRKIYLADGGIYDNMGIESLIGKVDIALVSDAGAPFSIAQSIRRDYLNQLGRVRDILIDQTRALRKRKLMEDFNTKRERGAYWGIGTKIADFKSVNPLAIDNEISKSLETEPTRLASIRPERQAQLINWGYALADSAMRVRTDLKIPQVSELPL